VAIVAGDLVIRVLDAPPSSMVSARVTSYSIVVIGNS
jgi:hypothetical protein